MDVLARNRIMELAERLDEALHDEPVQIGKAQTISRLMVAAAEEHGAVLKTIQDLARYGQPAIRTQHWLAAIQKSTPDADTPEVA